MHQRTGGAAGAYFGQDVRGIVDRLLGEQLSDGGWNCEAPNGSTRSSFNTTICVLEALLEHERADGGSPQVTEARLRGQEYLLERRLFRRRSTGEVIERDRKGGAAWTRFAFPTWWHYDVLRGLEYLRSAGVTPDERVAEAIELVASKRDGDGQWPLEQRVSRRDAGRDGRGRGPTEPVEHPPRLTSVGLVFSTRTSMTLRRKAYSALRRIVDSSGRPPEMSLQPTSGGLGTRSPELGPDRVREYMKSGCPFSRMKPDAA